MHPALRRGRGARITAPARTSVYAPDQPRRHIHHTSPCCCRQRRAIIIVRAQQPHINRRDEREVAQVHDARFDDVINHSPPLAPAHRPPSFLGSAMHGRCERRRERSWQHHQHHLSVRHKMQKQHPRRAPRFADGRSGLARRQPRSISGQGRAVYPQFSRPFFFRLLPEGCRRHQNAKMCKKLRTSTNPILVNLAAATQFLDGIQGSCQLLLYSIADSSSSTITSLT